MRGEAWYRSRIETGHGDFEHFRSRSIPPVVEDEPWLPLSVLNQADDRTCDVAEQAIANAMAETVRAALVAALTLRLNIIVESHYGFYGGEPRTLAQIGWDLNLTDERVRQLLGDAHRLLRWLLAEEEEEIDEVTRR